MGGTQKTRRFRARAGLIHAGIISSMHFKEISDTFPSDIRALLDALRGDIVAYREHTIPDEHGGKSGRMRVQLTVRAHRLPPMPRHPSITELRISADDDVELDLRFSRREAQ